VKDGFEHGKRLGHVIRSEHADDVYTTNFIKALFEREGEGLFDVRGVILGNPRTT
jgi:6-phosphofructokinase 1